ncbi:MAG: TolC family protein [Candidatus Marinarcus sp.]|uniref:TolC family protein n=1 Tax=Candidatus Marinarcus sp. TaxID=3100987 RepID=UPI003AFF805A
MIQKRVVYSFLALALSANAINLEQSIDIAVKNNFSIAEQQYVTEEKNALKNAQYSGFLPSVDLTYTYDRRDVTLPSQVNDESYASAKVSYNLFNGFSDLFSFQSANYIYKSSEFTYNAVKQDIILNTKIAYIHLLKQEKNVKTYEDALKLFLQQYEDAKNKFDQGIIAKNELLEVEVQMLQAKQDLATANKDFKVARLSLNNILSGQLSKEEPIEEISYEKLAIKDYKEDFLERRSEIQALKMMMQSYNAQRNSTIGNFLPNVDASVSHNEYGDSERINGRTGYPDEQEVVNVTATWNLFSGGKDTQNAIAFNKMKKQIYAQLQSTKLQVQLQYEQAKEELNVSKLNFETATTALEQAKINYEIVNNRFIQGISTSSDLIDANFLLSKAKQSYFAAYYDKFLAAATLQRVVEEN